MSKVSVIMPCLNMAKYIKQSVESVMGQTIYDIDIIIVDAGSCDGTLNILEDLAATDNRIIILHSEIKSYGYQVNMGIEYAAGDYIGIVDTDDYITNDAYEYLYNKAIETDADYVKGTALGFWNISSKIQYTFPIKPFQENNDDISLVPLQSPFLLTCDNFLWYGLYKSKFIKKIKLHESAGAAFQDFGALFQIQTTAQSAVYTDHVVYYYRQDNINASTYNHRGMHFVANEYGWAEKFLPGLSNEWKSSFYKKQFLHLIDRIHAMAASKEYWQDSESDMFIIANRISKALECGILNKNDLDDNAIDDYKLLTKSPFKLYEKYVRLYIDSLKQLRDIVDAVNLSDQKDVVVFGAGTIGHFIAAQLIYRKCGNVLCFCDNNTEIQSTEWNGITIFSPKYCVENYNNIFYITANSKHSDEMKQQLIELGVMNKNIMNYSGFTEIHLFGEKI